MTDNQQSQSQNYLPPYFRMIAVGVGSFVIGMMLEIIIIILHLGGVELAGYVLTLFQLGMVATIGGAALIFIGLIWKLHVRKKEVQNDVQL